MKKLSLTILMVLVFSGTALAHKVNIFAWVAEETVYCETYFPDGRPVVNGKIIVLDQQDNTIITGDTDDNGLFNFKVAKSTELTIVIDAGMGHKNSFSLKGMDFKP